MKHTFSGSSLLELKAKYGTGSSAFWDNSWWLKESFASEKPPKGVYEIVLHKELINKTYTEQVEKLPEGFTPIHLAILAEAILEHFKKTGEKLLSDWYCRTSAVDSRGDRVYVGYFDSDGLNVCSLWVDRRGGHFGVASARKFRKGASVIESSEPVDPLNLASRLSTVEQILKKHNFTL